MVFPESMTSKKDFLLIGLRSIPQKDDYNEVLGWRETTKKELSWYKNNLFVVPQVYVVALGGQSTI